MSNEPSCSRSDSRSSSRPTPTTNPSRPSLFKRVWNQITSPRLRSNNSNPHSSIPNGPQRTVSYKSIQLTQIHHNNDPILQISYQMMDGSSTAEFYPPRDVKHAVADLLHIFKDPNNDVFCLRVNWQARQLETLLSAIEKDKAKLYLRIQKFASDRTCFFDPIESTYLSKLFDLFQAKYIQFQAMNLYEEQMDEMFATHHFQNAEGIALRIPKGVPMPTFNASKLRLTCDYCTALDVYNIAKVTSSNPYCS
ncbi:hypothetical protein B9Z55_021968 [Caenorhabditis nigoni]|uniref:Uncharacterized protein n=1 Tax=Caenorhabditis nigoni TaxID=1611254 RepID=A0A2G5TUC6_9PELO|nr:hypothetical protein B9Z55_021968 [Caenorhabditis nigoni]